ncbi:cell division protein ZapA [Rhodohalobacter mucosus]|uniref:Cell division protein ZapA n=1 Tax=Rhodohalobacter mucosus TaxID=2079485 RepID=A0A316TSH5_9BACT|nr:cell division protein ZapA [Rhodohalobacter mucosus]PWN07527.1 cell division protein ZapA [Rhodohalobacter mucosus]
MQSIKVTVLGKQIPLKVEDSEVENTRKIAQYVDDKFKTYRNQLSNQPDSTIMILACLSIAEEVFELRSQYDYIEGKESDLMDQVNQQLERFVQEIS